MMKLIWDLYLRELPILILIFFFETNIYVSESPTATIILAVLEFRYDLLLSSQAHLNSKLQLGISATYHFHMK